jgi:hypothetical protein
MSPELTPAARPAQADAGEPTAAAMASHPAIQQLKTALADDRTAFLQAYVTPPDWLSVPLAYSCTSDGLERLAKRHQSLLRGC